MTIPELNGLGLLPLGRYRCDLAELERRFVDSEVFSGSQRRARLVADLRSMIAVFEAFGGNIIEAIWIGGSFTTSKLEPDDVDCLFLINEEAFDRLPSNRKKSGILALGRKGYVRQKMSLDVESFVLIRRVFANPWAGGGVVEHALPYISARGAWDDWWLRTRSTERAEAPTTADAHPRRGYLEVTAWPSIDLADRRE